MNRLFSRLPLLITVFAVIALLLHGPIAQLANYHEFADQRSGLGLPNLARADRGNLPLAMCRIQRCPEAGRPDSSGAGRTVVQTVR